MQSLLDNLKTLLQKDERLVSEGELLKNKIIELAIKLDKDLIELLFESKGDQFKDNKGRFENSKEGWKQKFLLELENKAKTDLKLENKNFKLIGLPFYNEKLKREFEEALENKILS